MKEELIFLANILVNKTTVSMLKRVFAITKTSSRKTADLKTICALNRTGREYERRIKAILDMQRGKVKLP